MAFENSQSQTGTIYGADQSSFGTVEASQNYYQETAPSQLQQSVPGSPYGENYQQSFGASYGRGYGPHVPYKPAPLSQMFLPAQAPQVPQMIYDSPPVSSQPTVKPFMPIAPRELRNANQYQQPTLGSQLYSGTGNPNYQAGPPGGGSLGHIEQVQFLGRRCLGFWLQLLQQGDLCP